MVGVGYRVLLEKHGHSGLTPGSAFSLTATNPFFIWEDGAAVFLDDVSKTILLERAGALALQFVLNEAAAPDADALRAWLFERAGEAASEADFDAFHATLIEIRGHLDAVSGGV